MLHIGVCCFLSVCRCRQAQAQLSGCPDYYTLTQQRLHPATNCDSDGEPHEIEFLLQLQEALAPLCQQEVEWVVSQATKQLPASSQQQQQQQLGGQQQQWGGVGAADSTPAAVITGPWDWDHLLQTALQPLSRSLQDNAGLLQQHMQLSGVVAGFSGLLQGLGLGVQLVPRAAGEAEVWAPHVMVLDVCQHQQQQQTAQAVDEPSRQPASHVQLGTVYLDVGGGYGARMLRYARLAPDSSSIDSVLPVVAVGISGTRIAFRHQQQQQQQQVESPGAHTNSSGCAVSPAVDCVLSIPQLWELAHELGHAAHLVLSSRCVVLSGGVGGWVLCVVSQTPAYASSSTCITSQTCHGCCLCCCRLAACHLSGRFLPPDRLELPPQLMERLLLDKEVLGRVCLHHTTQQPMPAHLAAALAAYYGSR